jgi:dihydrolipoamide dehydrogenase
MPEKTKKYDVVVIGSGSGGSIVQAALHQGFRVAYVDRGPLGGTCLNVGCIPSKMLIASADRVVEIQESGKLGIAAEIQGVDFETIMERMRRSVGRTREQIREGIRHTGALDFYEEVGYFVEPHVLEIAEERIRGQKIFIASGARPGIPDLDGLDDVEYLTNESVLQLEHPPESLIIIGGGYIGCEYAHFFSAMGTRVTVLSRSQRLLPGEEPEISELLADSLSRRMEIRTGVEAVAVRPEGDGVVVEGSDQTSGERSEFTAHRIMIAAGRRSNTDLLKAEAGGIELDDRGYIRVNRYLETNLEDVWAFGDAIGRHMFTHVANREVGVAWRNSLLEDQQKSDKEEMDYRAVPHAVFSHPQIASVGMTQARAAEEHELFVGVTKYGDVAKGEAIREEEGFAKIIIDRQSERILGFHIVGPHAPMLIQEVIDTMANDLPAGFLTLGMHIHPALSELIPRTLGNLHRPE